MYIEITSKGNQPRFAMHELTEMEIELIQNGLIQVKQHSLQDAEAFKAERSACNDMFMKIDLELRNSKL